MLRLSEGPDRQGTEEHIRKLKWKTVLGGRVQNTSMDRLRGPESRLTSFARRICTNLKFYVRRTACLLVGNEAAQEHEIKRTVNSDEQGMLSASRWANGGAKSDRPLVNYTD